MSEVIQKLHLNVKKDSEVSDIHKQHLITAKVDLIRAYPFLGFLVMSTEYFFCDEVPTMAATTMGKNGNTIYINEKFLSNVLTDKRERSFVIAHEILHIFLEHVGRGRENQYHPSLWNIAADYCINSYLNELKSDKLKSNKLQMPKFGLYDQRFKSMSADEIYHKLLQENGGDADKAAENHGGSKIGDGTDGEGNATGDNTPRPFDEISREEVDDATKISNKQKVASALSQSDVEALKQMGSGMADLIRTFEDLIESKIPWNKLLREFITDAAKSRYTYNRPSRRSTDRVIFPSQTGEHVNLVFGVDTSGSMSVKDLNDAMSELKAITEEFDSWEITFLSCDTGAHEIGKYVSEDGDEFATIDKKMIGGGGTDMNPMVEYANEMDDVPNVCVILTDGYIPDIDTVDDIPVIVVVTRDGNHELTQDDCEVLYMED